MCLSPYFGALVSRGRRSLQVQILPWGGGNAFQGGSEMPFSAGEERPPEV